MAVLASLCETHPSIHTRLRTSPLRSTTTLAIALSAGILIAAVAGSSRADDAAKKAGPKFTKLYNGKNLDGWEVQDGDLSCWQPNGELLSCVKKGGGWL